MDQRARPLCRNHSNLRAVGVENSFAHGQTEPGPSVATSRGTVGLPESREEKLLRRGGNTGAPVPDRDPGLTVIAGVCVYTDRFLRLRKLDGIRDEIQQDVTDLLPIATDRKRVRGHAPEA